MASCLHSPLSKTTHSDSECMPLEALLTQLQVAVTNIFVTLPLNMNTSAKRLIKYKFTRTDSVRNTGTVLKSIRNVCVSTEMCHCIIRICLI